MNIEDSIKAKEHKILHILRNPYGWSESDVRWARLEGAKLIEDYKDAYLNMRDFAEENRLNTATTNQGGQDEQTDEK